MKKKATPNAIKTARLALEDAREHAYRAQAAKSPQQREASLTACREAVNRARRAHRRVQHKSTSNHPWVRETSFILDEATLALQSAETHLTR